MVSYNSDTTCIKEVEDDEVMAVVAFPAVPSATSCKGLPTGGGMVFVGRDWRIICHEHLIFHSGTTSDGI